MYSRRLKAVYFLLEGLNALAVTYYFFYLFFLLRDQFHFGKAENLAAGAIHGLVWTIAPWFGGRFAQRAGYFTALLLGWSIMGGVLLAGLALDSATGQLVVLGAWTFGMSFTWPTLEALASERESDTSLPRMIGIYNVVWAGCGAVAYFVGGAVMEGLGPASLFWLPALVHGLQLLLVLGLKRAAAAPGPEEAATVSVPGNAGHEARPARLKVPPKAFLRMAWLANPFAYVAMNAAIPIIPMLAEELRLTKTGAGFFCSVWFFARLATFALLWGWTGWHYRFRWLLGSFALLIVCFLAMLVVRVPAVIIVAQAGFGFAVGLIYYSSLFYSMDVGETKGEHGGIHEAAIGSGIFGGAAIGAAGQFVLGGEDSSTWVVSGVLVLGLVALLWLYARNRGAVVDQIKPVQRPL